MESGWIFLRVLSLVVQKHSYELDYQDTFFSFKTVYRQFLASIFQRHPLCYRIEVCYRKSTKSS